LGLAIGVDFFSSQKTDYKLLKGIDIARWRIKSHRWLKNISRLDRNVVEKFLKPKVICQRVIAHIDNPTPHIKITACYDEEGIIITNTLMSFALDPRIKPKVWLAYLNSTFTSWFMYNFVYARAIRTMDLYDSYVRQIPIPTKILNNDNQSLIGEVVDKILCITKTEINIKNPDKQVEIKEYEKQIDQLVYKLYGLTPEEIAVVENKK